MDRFKPADSPVWKKILGSPFLYVSLTFLVVFASIRYVREQQREELKTRVEYLRGGPVLIERKEAPAETQAATEAAPPQKNMNEQTSAPDESMSSETAASTVPAPKTQIPPPAESPPPPSSTASATPPAAVKAAETGSSLKPAGNRVTVIYAEIEQTTLNAWMEEIKANGHLRTFDEVSMGPLPHIEQKLKSSRGVKILQQMNHPFQPTSQAPIEWFAGTHRTQDPDNEIGFLNSLLMGDSKDDLVRGEIEVQRAFRDPSDPGRAMERISYGGPFELPTTSGFIIRGLLPRKYATRLDDESNSDPFLSIFKSSAFRNGQTEFTLILEFDTSSSLQR